MISKQIILLIWTDQNRPRLIDNVKSELVNKITLSATDFYALMDFSWQAKHNSFMYARRRVRGTTMMTTTSFEIK